ncbi:hypothetical protein Peur_057300 [Populus x canadensis]
MEGVSMDLRQSYQMKKLKNYQTWKVLCSVIPLFQTWINLWNKIKYILSGSSSSPVVIFKIKIERCRLCGEREMEIHSSKSDDDRSLAYTYFILSCCNI